MNLRRVLILITVAGVLLPACRTEEEFSDDAYPIPMPGRRMVPESEDALFPPSRLHTDDLSGQGALGVQPERDAGRQVDSVLRTGDVKQVMMADTTVGDASIPGLPGMCRLEAEGVRGQRTADQITIFLPVSNGFEGPIQPTVQVQIRHVLNDATFSQTVRPGIPPGGGIASVVFDKLPLAPAAEPGGTVGQDAVAGSKEPQAGAAALEAEYLVTYRVECSGSSDEGETSLVSLLDHANLIVYFPESAEPGLEIPVLCRFMNTAEQTGIEGEEVVLTATARETDPVRAVATTGADGVAVPVLPPLSAGQWELTASVGTGQFAPVIPVSRILDVRPAQLAWLWLDRPSYSLGDTVKGRLLALTGRAHKPLASAPFTLEIRDPSDCVVFQHAGSTSDYGLLDFEFPIAPGALPGDHRLSIAIGETLKEDKVISVQAAPPSHYFTAVSAGGGAKAAPTGEGEKKDPIRDSGNIHLIPESGQVVTGLVNRFFVVVEDRDGNAVEAQTTLDFIARGKDTMSGTQQVQAPGIVTIPVGHQGLEVKTRVTLAGERLERSFAFRGLPDARLLVRPDQVLIGAGDRLTVQVLSTAGGKDAVVTLTFAGAMLDYALVPLDESGTGSHAFTLPEDLFGFLLVSAWEPTPPGKLLHDSRSVFVQSKGRLNVSVRTAQEQYKPGETAELRILVTDENERPAVAALGVAVAGVRDTGSESARWPGVAYFPVSIGFPEGRALLSSGTGAHDLLHAIVAGDAGRVEAVLAALDDSIPVHAPESTWDRDRNAMKERAQCLVAQHVQEPVLEALKGLWDKHGQSQAFEEGASAILTTERMDPWKTQVRFNASGSNALKSAGPDRRFGTWDDCIFPVDLARLRARWSGKAEPVDQPEPGIDVKDSVAQAGGSHQRSLLFEPALLTDERGEAVVQVRLADEQSRWQTTVEASDLQGRLGENVAWLEAASPLSVVPEAPEHMTAGDRLTIPVLVVNRTDTATDTLLEFQGAGWFHEKSTVPFTVHLEPHGSASIQLPMHAALPGLQTLAVSGFGTNGSKTFAQTPVLVSQQGRRNTAAVSGYLEPAPDSGEPALVQSKVSFPRRSLESSQKLVVRVMPDVLSTAAFSLEGLEAMHTAGLPRVGAGVWMRATALSLLQIPGLANPEMAKQMSGRLLEDYQHLLAFRASGGGFSSWPGEAQGSILMAAIALRSLSCADRAISHVDPRILAQTAEFLRGMQRADGTWSLDESPHEPTTTDLALSCFVVGALGRSAGSEESNKALVAPTVNLVLRLTGSTDRYALAMCADALTAVGLTSEAAPILERLFGLSTGRNGRLSFRTNKDGRTLSSGGPRLEAIETAALALSACVGAGDCGQREDALVAWLAGRQSFDGTWGGAPHTTAVVLSALAAFQAKRGAKRGGSVSLELNGRNVAIADLSKVTPGAMLVLDVPHAKLKRDNRVAVRIAGNKGAFFGVGHSWHSPWPKRRKQQAYEVSFTPERLEMAAGETVTASLKVQRATDNAPEAVEISLPIPTGFEMGRASLVSPGANTRLAFQEYSSGELHVYLEGVPREQSVQLAISLTAHYPGVVSTGAVRATGCFDPSYNGYQDPLYLTTR